MSQNICSQINVADFLKNKTLSEFVASCDSSEENALKVLCQFEIPDTLVNNSFDYMWYDNFALNLDYSRRSGSFTPQYYASLKLKAYSWIIRIFRKDYDECKSYLYDFGFYDYERYSKNNTEPIMICKKEDKLHKKIILELKKWFENMNCLGLENMRQRGLSPIYPNKYHLRSNIDDMVGILFNEGLFKSSKIQSNKPCDVTYYLKYKSLSDFVSNCDSNEVLALQRLRDYCLPEKCLDSLMWYSDIDKNRCYNYEKGPSIPQKYASLKLKAYSWIIRIWMKQYDECDEYYDFDFFDYESKGGIVKKLKTKEIEEKEIEIEKSISIWFEFLEKYGLENERIEFRSPIQLMKYSIFIRFD